MRKISRIKVNKAKEYLQQAYTANEKIIQCNYILEQLQASPSKMTTSYKENIGHSGINNDVSGYVAKLIEQEEKIEAMKQEYQSKQFEISNFILEVGILLASNFRLDSPGSFKPWVVKCTSYPIVSSLLASFLQISLLQRYSL